MSRGHVIDKVCADILEKYSARTVLLYGSEADGTATAESDLDIAGFGRVPEQVRDARLLDGVYIDVFVYPECALENPDEEHLRLRGGKILRQENGSAERFLAGVEKLYRDGPKPLPEDELSARREWAWKMLARMALGDIEGNFRRVWLLTVLLEDYFHLRGQWYEGPKKSFLWMRQHDPAMHDAFEQALKPGADDASIKTVVGHVVNG